MLQNTFKLLQPKKEKHNKEEKQKLVDIFNNKVEIETKIDERTLIRMVRKMVNEREYQLRREILEMLNGKVGAGSQYFSFLESQQALSKLDQDLSKFLNDYLNLDEEDLGLTSLFG